MPFQQLPPTLGNQYEDDRVLRLYLTRVLPAEVLREIEPSLGELGALAGGELYRLQLADRLNEPTLTQWDAWGQRVDEIELTPLWRVAERIAAEYGVVAAAYEGRYGRFALVRPQVVHLSRHLADGADARTSRRQSDGRARSCALLPRTERWRGPSAPHRNQSAQRQTWHAQSADRRIDSVGRARATCLWPNRRRAQYHAHAQYHAPVERHQRHRAHAPRAGACARLRAQACGLWRPAH